MRKRQIDEEKKQLEAEEEAKERFLPLAEDQNAFVEFNICFFVDFVGAPCGRNM